MQRNVIETVMGGVVLIVAAMFVGIAFRSGTVTTPAGYQVTAEFDDAKNEQAFVEGRILTLEQMIQHATIIDEEQAHRASRVQIGSTVTVSEGNGKKLQQYHIIGSAEADPKEGRISNESPGGIALLGKRPGAAVRGNVRKGGVRAAIPQLRCVTAA